jgi:hypothetical protein
LGSEPDPDTFVDSLVRVFRLVRDAMADHAVAFVNIGDTFSGGSGNGDIYGPGKVGPKGSPFADKPPVALVCGNCGIGFEGFDGQRFCSQACGGVDNTRKTGWRVPGNLCLIPWRLALALQEDGWLCRSVIAWTKPACMPASLRGWSWQRHRVKVAAAPGGDRVKAGQLGQRNAASLKDERTEAGRILSAADRAAWADCPGCPKCRPTDGLVLRKGSWRPTSSWEPILLLAKSPSYFMDGEAVRTPSAPATVGRNRYTRVLDDPDEQFAVRHDHETTAAGANLRDVWRTDLDDLTREELVGLVRQLRGADMPDRLSVAAEPLHESHYASFPSALVRKCLLAGTSARGYCPACSSPWVRIIEQGELVKTGKSGNTRPVHDSRAAGRKAETNTQDTEYTPGMSYENKTIGWRPSCRCEPVREPRPAVVLDPFCGAGRTGVAARQLGLDFIGVELNAESVEIARRQIDNALRETKRQKPKPGAGLFDGLAAPGPGGGPVP